MHKLQAGCGSEFCRCGLYPETKTTDADTIIYEHCGCGSCADRMRMIKLLSVDVSTHANMHLATLAVRFTRRLNIKMIYLIKGYHASFVNVYFKQILEYDNLTQHVPVLSSRLNHALFFQDANCKLYLGRMKVNEAKIYSLPAFRQPCFELLITKLRVENTTAVKQNYRLQHEC